MGKYQTYDIKTGIQTTYKGEDINSGIEKTETIPRNNSIITPADLIPEPTINIPLPPADDTNYQGIINEGQTYSAAANNAITAANTPAPVDETTNLLNQYLKDSKAPESQADIYAELYGTTPEKLRESVATEETDVAAKSKIYKEAQDEFNLLQAEMEALNLEAKAAPEQVQQESEGRGRTTGGIAPLTTAKLRNIALRSLPLQGQMYAAQAKVANAQGNVLLAQNLLDKAQAKLDKVFILKLDDAERQYNYQQNLRKEVFGFKYEKATAEEKRKLDIIDRDETRKYAENQEKLKNAQSIIAQATQAGQFDIASKIAQLDETSPTYEQDLLKLQEKITPEGWTYVKTPAERDALIKQGYEIMQRGGRTYAKAGTGASPEVKAYVNQIRAGKIKLTSVPTALRGQVAVALGGDMGAVSPISPTKEQAETSTDNITDWDKSKQFILDNPNATPQEIRQALLENTKLSITEINSLIPPEKEKTNIDLIKENKASGISREEVEKAGFSEEDIKQVYGEKPKKWWQFWRD